MPFLHEQNQYFEEAKRLAAEERKRRLLSARPPPSLIQSSVTTNSANANGSTDKAKDKKRRSSAKITPGGLYESSSEEGLPAGLGVLKNTKHVFIQRAGTEFVDRFFDLRDRFDLLNTTGERIFFAGETIQADSSEGSDKCCGGGPLIATPYDVTVVGCEGGGILSVVSKSSGVTTITDFRNLVGTVTKQKEFSWCCGSILCGYITTYSVRDKSGNEVFRIGPRKSEYEGATSPDGPSDYNIFTPNIKELIGRISRKWTDIPPHALWSNAYGVGFPENTPIEHKALLMGALITVVGNNSFRGLGGFMQRDY